MDRQIFNTTDSNLLHRNGQQATVLRVITEPEPGFDAESLPMMKIRFGDGYVTECWPDELETLTATAPAYRDVL